MRKKLLYEVQAQRNRKRAPRVLAAMAAVLSIAMLILGAAACTGPTETRDDSFIVGENVNLIVTTMNGSIDIEAGDDGEVRVRATLEYPSKIEYELIQDGDTITVNVRQIGKFVLFGGRPGADITITTPASTDLELRTSNGHIEVRGTEGSAYLKTSNGRLALNDVTGTFDARTSNGRIEVDTMDGTARLRTSNGSMDISGLRGGVDAETSNGSISFDGELTAGGDNRLVTSNGSVHVELRGTPSVSLDASTSNGSVNSQRPILATVTKENHIVGSYGDAEADLYIRTSNGSVTIR